MTGNQDQSSPVPGSRWETLVWPRWLPVRARLPLIAQLTAAGALVAAVTMPTWSEVTPEPITATAPPPAALAAPVAPAVPEVVTPSRPAHLNLDLRHRFRSVDLTVLVDDKRVLETRLEGSGKKFGVFGSRGERQFTRSLELPAGVSVVRLRIRSAADKFDHSRVERFDLGEAAVATMRIGVDKSGLDVMTDRPPAPVPVAAPAAAPVAAAGVVAASAPAPVASASAAGNALAELYQTLRRLLIALTGFIASVAAAYLFEEFLKSRNVTLFSHGAPAGPQPAPTHQFARQSRTENDADLDAGLS